MPRSARQSDYPRIGVISGRPIATFLIGMTALWFVVEWFLFGLIAGQIGWFPTIVLSIFKGGFGLILLGFVLKRMQMNFRDLVNTGGGTFSIAEPLLAVFGAILICLPGFVATLIGLSLFAPSVRHWLLGRFRQRSKPGYVDLSREDYREIGS